MSEYRYIGKPTRRIDGTGIVTGRTKYSDDLIIPNALYLRVLRSPHAHAEIVSIDTSKAEALPGVRSVMTYKNAPAWKTGCVGWKRARTIICPSPSRWPSWWPACGPSPGARRTRP